MKKPAHLLLLFFFMLNCGELVPNPDKNPDNMTRENPDPKSNSEKVNEFAIVIHGGAGTILKKNMSEEKEAEYKAKLEEAIRVGYSILDKGGSSLDAVEKTINVLENSPLFNAGKGAVFTNAETNELDASIMDGKTLNAGASAGTKTVKNPINLARAIMENSPHVMMAGDGAETFAKEQNLEIVSPEYFKTENRLNTLKRVIKKEQEKTKKQNLSILRCRYKRQ